jgi:16S rRNA (uracil1498-N3)-methyltransferase
VSRHRFFLPRPLPVADDGETIILPLSPADLHHAVGVLRVRSGEELDVVEPGGGVWRVRVAAALRDTVTATVVERVEPDGLGGAEVTLAFGISKGAKNDDIVEGAVEVGAARLLPVVTARSVVKLDAEKRAERGARWRRVASAAAKQSKRAYVPEVDDPVSLADALPLLAAHDVVIVAWEECDSSACGVRMAIAEALAAAALPEGMAPRVAVVVGPEGGLSATEVRALEAIGARRATLGSTILRAETAAVVATALVVHELGGLGNTP